MKFFFPDSQDLIDPHFDFVEEAHPEFRVRQQDDRYAHEVFAVPPFDGLLVSKAIVDGAGSSSGKYTLAQRHRLLRLGIREFLRAHQELGRPALEIMGDCGAFTYKDEDTPPYSVEEVVDFYDALGFDFGISLDHVILTYEEEWDSSLPGVDPVPKDIRLRQDLTLQMAAEFRDLSVKQSVKFKPLGVAQGWSPASYAHAVGELQRIGYDYVAIGGMVPLKTSEILRTLTAIDAIRHPGTKLHLLGVTRLNEVSRFRGLGVVSFDSTSPFLQAFKDAKDNYHTVQRTYSGIRVPQVEGSPKLARLIRSGRVEQGDAQRLEQLCLDNLRKYDRGEVSLSEVLGPLESFEILHAGSNRRLSAYREVLEDRPWQSCSCDICTSVGIEVVMFRGSERNKRRGFHNLAVFRQKLTAASQQILAEVP